MSIVSLCELRRAPRSYWVLLKSGGAMDRRRVARARAISQGVAPDAEWRAELERIDCAAAVLTDVDLAFWNENGYVILA